jgi:hypothetical protein
MVNHNTTEVFFDGARVPAENLIGEHILGHAALVLNGLVGASLLANTAAAPAPRPGWLPSVGLWLELRPRKRQAPAAL